MNKLIYHVLVIEYQDFRRTLILDAPVYSIGRGPTNSIFIPSKKISRHHASLIKKTDVANNFSYWIIDGDLQGNKSTNGILINDKKGFSQSLKTGDVIKISAECCCYYSILHGLKEIEELKKGDFENKNSAEINWYKLKENEVSADKNRIPSRDEPQEEQSNFGNIYDIVTGLPNLILFVEQLNTAAANARRNKQLMAIIVIKLNQFDQQSLGTITINEFIKDFTQRLKICFRSGDTIARSGEYQFIALLPQIHNIKYISRIAQRIFDKLQQPIGKREIYISKNIGIALYPEDGSDAQSLIEKAQNALKSSQEIGENNYQFYSKKINQEVARVLRLESLLQSALNEEQFFMVYQPQVNIKQEKIVGVDALLRWQHPKLGLVSPSQFIPLAEETGFIIKLGEWALKTICNQSRIWQNSEIPPISIFINLSLRQFQHPDLAAIIQEILEQTNLAPKLLELEITESTIMENPQLARKTILALQKTGVSICMDNFGIGSSGLGYLTEFGFNTIKIDRSLIKDLSHNKKNQAIILAALALCANLKMRVVAEGVETMEQLALVRNLQCEEIQGYFFSVPLNVTDVTDLLKSPSSIFNLKNLKSIIN